MAQLTEPKKALLFAAVMYSDKDSLDKAISGLEKKFGPIKAESKEFDFTKFSKYYIPEMGNKQMKKYILFEKPFDRSSLADARLLTQELENKLSKGKEKKRTVNIDPGYITKGALVLASLKEKGHKIYLGKGVFADMQALFGKDEMQVFEYTFDDIKANAAFFLESRKDLLNSELRPVKDE